MRSLGPDCWRALSTNLSKPIAVSPRMIAPNHGFSGYICGQIAMPLLKRHSPLTERVAGLAFFLGAMMPDADIFTKTLLGRQAYFGAAFYAHRHASHSILGTLALALIAAGLLTLLPPVRRAAGQWRGYAWLVACFWVGGMIHLVGDVFTPGWPLPLFWPLPMRYGGWSHIGWFSPYLFWLFLTAIAVGWGVRALTGIGTGNGTGKDTEKGTVGRGFLARKILERWGGAVTTTLGNGWAAGGLWLWYTVAVYRWLDFMATSQYETWGQWLAFHRQLLPNAMIVPVTEGVRVVWHWLSS